jgi:hypothetical protein
VATTYETGLRGGLRAGTVEMSAEGAEYRIRAGCTKIAEWSSDNASQPIGSGADPRAFEFVKAVQAEAPEWGEDYRDLGREAIAAILGARLRHLEPPMSHAAEVIRHWS